LENGKTSRKPKRIVLLLIAITLAVNAILTGINLYLFFQFNQDLSNFEFQNRIPGSTFFIVVRADDSDLGNPVIYLGREGRIEQTVHYGKIIAEFQVAIPHYGALAINLKSFNVTVSDYLNSEMRNETEVTYADKNTNQVYILVPGLNQISAQLPLKAQVYPISEKIPSNGESVKILLGDLTLQAESFDFETHANVTSEFSADIFVDLEMPP